METDNAFRTEIDRLRQWTEQNSKFIIVNCLILCYLYSSWVFSRAPLVDTMLYINLPSSSYNWLSIGREGAVLSKWIFQHMNYNPYLATGMGYIFLCVGGNIFGYIGYRCSKKYSWLWTFSPFMFLCPIFAEQFYFKLQILEIGWGYILCASAVALNYFIVFRKKRWIYIISVAMMIWSFHTYQTFVIIYAVMVGCAYIFLCLSGTIHENRKDITWWSLLLEHIVVFGVANILGQIITSMFFTSSGYLESTILWQSVPIDVCIKNIIKHAMLIFVGNSENIFFTKFYGLLALIIIVLALRAFLRNRNKCFLIMLLASLGIQFAPLLITIYTGSMPSIRGQLVYPFVLVFDGFISLIMVGDKKEWCWKAVRAGIGCLMIMTLWQQISVTMRLIYTNEVRADEDSRIAQTLETRLIEMNAANKPIAFIGGYENLLNPVCVRGEMIGQSMFNMFTETTPYYAVSTWHTCSAMNTVGIRREQADNNQIDYARRVATNMPIWPARDSVLDLGDFVVVKWGPDQWAEEILSTDVIPVNEENLQYVDDLTASIEPVSYNENEMIIKGWCIRDGVHSGDFVPKVCLKDNNSGQFYLLSTSAVKREELIQFFGSSHQNGGFIAKADLDKLKVMKDEFSIYVGYEENRAYYLVGVQE